MGRSPYLFLLLLLTLLAGCERREEIKVYRLAKADSATTSSEADRPMSMSGPASSTMERGMTTPSVKVPPNWEPQRLTEMRQASFLVHGANGATADVSFVKLGPAAGNVLDNVNRWLGQLGQPPLTPDKLTTTIQKLATPHGEADVVDLSGKPENGDISKDGRILAAIASDDGTSFYKMRGNPDVVGAEKDNFLKWVVAMRSAPAGNETVASAEPAAEKPEIKWDVPADWSPAPASAMRYASFAATTDNGEKLDISVVTFPGDGGSDLGNINRWRQQIGLPPVEGTPNNVTPLKTNDTTFSTVDLAASNSRMLAAWTRKDGRAWFFKLTGPNDAVEKEKPEFVKFIQSVRF
jgi:hypothetical protein